MALAVSTAELNARFKRIRTGDKISYVVEARRYYGIVQGFRDCAPRRPGHTSLRLVQVARYGDSSLGLDEVLPACVFNRVRWVPGVGIETLTFEVSDQQEGE